MFALEQKYFGLVAGVDEAGRGPLVGPVVAASVIIDQTKIINGIKDSKKLTREKRNLLYEQITQNYIWSVGIVYHDEIDIINILEATKKACTISVANLSVKPDTVLIDGNMKFDDSRFISIVNGDNLSISIGAASIIAKVTRDRLLLEYAKEFPEYMWHKNFGYGTKEHLNAIHFHGLSPYHRKSFKVKSFQLYS
ncbi:ribonuclease HII [Candidatus Tisiphia endosymbiont of Hybos culiciformis]|uniref:ribonuclease HII n=1 Tax=Candidatus Tisiphia endosymbiont of Hybos culiciformis TaxID=3139331 RepID=UPI003CCB4869